MISVKFHKMLQPEMLSWKKTGTVFVLMLSCNAVSSGILQNYSAIYVFGAEGNLGLGFYSFSPIGESG